MLLDFKARNFAKADRARNAAAGGVKDQRWGGAGLRRSATLRSSPAPSGQPDLRLLVDARLDVGHTAATAPCPARPGALTRVTVAEGPLAAEPRVPAPAVLQMGTPVGL